MNLLRWVKEVETVNDLTIRMTLPSFINKTVCSIVEVTPDQLLKTWQTHPVSSATSAQDKAAWPLPAGRLKQFRFQRALEESADFPVEMPIVTVQQSGFTENAGYSRTHLDISPPHAEWLGFLSRSGVKSIPVCVATGCRDNKFKPDYKATGKFLGSNSPAIPAIVLEEHITAETADFVGMFSKDLCNSLSLSDLAEKVDSFAIKVKRIRGEYDQAMILAENSKPVDFDTAEAEAMALRDQYIRQYGLNEFSEILCQFDPIRYNDTDCASYRFNRGRAENVETLFQFYDGHDVASEMLDALICAGVYGVTVGSHYDGHQIVSALGALMETHDVQMQINYPMGSALEVADRFEATIARLNRRIEIRDGKQFYDNNAARLATMVMPLARVILDYPEALSLVEQECGVPARAVLQWTREHPFADQLDIKNNVLGLATGQSARVSNGPDLG